jgi:hypothetical protein
MSCACAVYQELGGDRIHEAAGRGAPDNSKNFEVIEAHTLLPGADANKGKGGKGKAKGPATVYPTSVIRLTPDQAGRLAPFYNRVWYRADSARLTTPVVNPNQKWAEVQRSYLESNPRVLVLDNFLTPEGLAKVSEWMWLCCPLFRPFLRLMVLCCVLCCVVGR